MKIDSNNKHNKYRKVRIMIQRTKQLRNGAQPRVLMPGARATRVAREEFEQELLAFNYVALPKEKR